MYRGVLLCNVPLIFFISYYPFFSVPFTDYAVWCGAVLTLSLSLSLSHCARSLLFLRQDCLVKWTKRGGGGGGRRLQLQQRRQCSCKSGKERVGKGRETEIVLEEEETTRKNIKQ